MGRSVQEGLEGEESRFLRWVEDGVSIGCEEVDKSVCCFRVFVEVVIT